MLLRVRLRLDSKGGWGPPTTRGTSRVYPRPLSWMDVSCAGSEVKTSRPVRERPGGRRPGLKGRRCLLWVNLSRSGRGRVGPRAGKNGVTASVRGSVTPVFQTSSLRVTRDIPQSRRCPFVDRDGLGPDARPLTSVLRTLDPSETGSTGLTERCSVCESVRS